MDKENTARSACGKLLGDPHFTSPHVYKKVEDIDEFEMDEIPDEFCESTCSFYENAKCIESTKSVSKRDFTPEEILKRLLST